MVEKSNIKISVFDGNYDIFPCSSRQVDDARAYFITPRKIECNIFVIEF